MTTTGVPENIQPLLREAKALNGILATIEGRSEPIPEAIRHVRDALGSRGEATNVSDALIQLAMEKIVGNPNPPVIHRSSTGSFDYFDHLLAEDTACQWMSWVLDGPVYLLWPSEGEKLPVESAVHENVLRLWRSAIVQLAKNDLEESQRLWKRAMNMGSQFGVESHVMLSWAYAATFFTREGPPVASDLPS